MLISAPDHNILSSYAMNNATSNHEVTSPWQARQIIFKYTKLNLNNSKSKNIKI